MKQKAMTKQEFKKKADQLLKKMTDANSRAHSIESKMTALIQPFVEIDDITVFWQAGDGFVIQNPENACNAPLDSCLHTIFEKGKLTSLDYENLTI